MLQLSSPIAHYGKSRSRALDIFDLKGHTLRVFNEMRALISDLPHRCDEPEIPDTRFILAGYSWKRKKFAIWVLRFNAHLRKFSFHPITPWKASGRKQIAIEGDHVDEAKRRLIEKLKTASKLSQGGFDMEPFEVLRDMIRSNAYSFCLPPVEYCRHHGHPGREVAPAAKGSTIADGGHGGGRNPRAEAWDLAELPAARIFITDAFNSRR
jgi:hypothetical protein